MRSPLLTAALILLTGCSLVPPSQAPSVAVPGQFKESTGWKVAQPADAEPRGRWWSRFHDSELSAILQQVEMSNQTLRSAVATADQATAVLKGAQLAFLPTARVDASGTRSLSGAQGGSANTNSLSSRAGTGRRQIKSLSGSTAWEIDLWGRLRQSAGAATADAQAAQATVAATRLSLQAQAAQTYFSLRSIDAQKKLLAQEVTHAQTTLDLTRHRVAQGVASAADTALAQTQLATTRAALIDLDVERSTLEHALATLTGQVPALFDLQPAALTAKIPAPPAALPSTLLERRPDIAAAERRVAAANARVGVARAAYFPSLTLSADTGWRGLADLLSKTNNFWSLGADIGVALLDQGQRSAAKAQADAAWQQTVADYRQTVLTALQEAEDARATLRILEQETTAQTEAVQAARESARITADQYKAGTVSFLNVTVAQSALLTAESQAISLHARRLFATVALVQALGGSW